MSSIPPHAKKVFEGIIFDTYQWEQELFDGSMTTFENVTRQSVVIMIPIVGDKILVVKEEQPGKPPYRTLPAGFSETYDQSALAAGQRELQEETGLTSDNWVLFETYNLHPRMDVVDYIYIARNCQRTHDKILDKGEKQHCEYLYSFDEFIDLVDKPDFASFFLKHHLIRAKYDSVYKQELYEKIFGV